MYIALLVDFIPSVFSVIIYICKNNTHAVLNKLACNEKWKNCSLQFNINNVIFEIDELCCCYLL